LLWDLLQDKNIVQVWNKFIEMLHSNIMHGRLNKGFVYQSPLNSNRKFRICSKFLVQVCLDLQIC
jgi:hypothetical protein